MVANIVAELKGGGFPEAADAAEQIELLRELSLDLKHSGLSPGQCAVGLAVLNRIKECDLDAADIGLWPAILKEAGSEQGAKEFVEIVYRIQEAQKKMGLTLEEVDDKLHELEMKAAELEPVTKQLEEHRKEVTELTKRRDELVPVVNNLEQKYGLLNPRVKDLEKREGELSRRIKDEEEKTEKAEATLATWSKEKQKLQEAGFSLEALVKFNDSTRAIAARHHIVASGLKDRLLHELESLDKGLGLETLIKGKEAELQKHQQTIASAKKEHEGLKGSIATLEQQKTALEANIKTTREKVSDEIAKIIPAAKETISQLAKELQFGNEMMLDDVRHLKDQALEVGREIGRYEGVVKVNEWLLELLSLVHGEEGLEAERVRTILLQVLRGGESWMKRNKAKIGLGTPTYTTARLIEELEQWRI
jgi:predicted  nucleic acid-binding Zn-ribbon protein